ncbi:MAG: DJ-1/PfpI family protein [Bacteroidales bacterium]|nr:DJ-1/PfpI family protein [Bacteroidales bacterium]
MKKAFIFLAEGFEDVEALATADVLRRGGVPTQLVSISDEPFVTSSHHVTVGADTTLDAGIEIDDDDVIIFPGGMPGTRNLAACGPLMDFMKEHYAQGGPVAAICAAPGLVFGQIDNLKGVEFTCFDGFEEGPVSKGATFRPAAAVVSGNMITGRSAGHAVEFALEILKYLKGSDEAARVEYAMNLKCV